MFAIPLNYMIYFSHDVFLFHICIQIIHCSIQYFKCIDVFSFCIPTHFKYNFFRPDLLLCITQ